MTGRSLRVMMISGLDAESFYGGSTRPFYLGKALSERGVRVLHVCRQAPKTRLPNTAFVTHGQLSNRLSRLVFAVVVLMRGWLFRPDVIYSHQLTYTAKVGGPLANVLRKPLVFDAHGSATQELIAGERKGGQIPGPTKEDVERRTLNAARYVIVVSPELKDFLRMRFSIPEERFILVPNGTNLKAFKETRSEAQLREVKRALQVSDTGKIVTFTCPRISPTNETALKWFFKVVKMVESRRRYTTFLILGGGKTIPSPSSSVVFTGFVEDLPGALAVSDVCVLPYPPEAICGGARNKALDYFAAGKPVVSTTEGMRGVSQAISGRDYLLADTIEEFCDRILELLSDQSLARQIGSNALAAAQKYDWSALGEKVYNLLSSLAE